jgi:hypothetical protein
MSEDKSVKNILNLRDRSADKEYRKIRNDHNCNYVLSTFLSIYNVKMPGICYLELIIG